MVGVDGDDSAEASTRLLTSRGFQTTQVPLNAVPQAIEATARGGGRVDAVVLPAPLDVGVGPDESRAVARNIRGLDERLSFRGGVRARTVPIVMHTRLVGAAARLRTFGSPPPPYLDDVKWYAWGEDDVVEAVVDVIGRWRQDLLNELDYVGYTVALDGAGRISVSHALRRKRRESELLADESTPGALRDAQFLILAEDFLDSFGRYDELKFLLEHYEQVAKSNGQKPETVFQRFFEAHPELIQRDAFSAVFAKPTLRLPEAPGRFYQPDFVMKPRTGASVGTNWEILDLKLPDDPLVTSGAFHPAFSSKLTRAVQQLRDYREYFSRHDTKDELIARFGYQPLHPRVAVLIGRRDRAEGLERAQGSAALDVDVITYDDIVEFEESRLVLQAQLAGLFNRQ
jgi:hypothetical protein